MSKPGISISDARMPSTSFLTVPPTENFPFAPLPTADPNAAPIAVPTAPIAWPTLVGDVGAERDGDAGDNACVVVALADRDGDARDGACVVVALADLLAAVGFLICTCHDSSCGDNCDSRSGICEVGRIRGIREIRDIHEISRSARA